MLGIERPKLTYDEKNESAAMGETILTAEEALERLLTALDETNIVAIYGRHFMQTADRVNVLYAR